MPPPATLNFLAGLFAAAGINMLTSVATGPLDVSIGAVVVDAMAWVLAAATTTWLAHILDATARAIADQLDDDFSAAEIAGVRTTVQAGMARRRRIAIAASIIGVGLGVVFLPNFGLVIL